MNYLHYNYTHSVFFTPVIPADILAIINSMKSINSIGHDNISSKFLKSIKEEIAGPLSILVNNSLLDGYVTDYESSIIPLYCRGALPSHICVHCLGVYIS